MPSTTKKQTIEDDVRGFSMVIREAIMDYYKGTCVQRFGTLSNYNVRYDRLRLPPVDSRRNFNYEREEWNRRNPVAYYLDNSKLFELWRDEHEVVFHPSVMRRSDHLSAAYDQIQDFFAKFLPTVEVIEKDGKNSKKHVDGSRDADWLCRKVEPNTPREEDSDEDFLDETDW